MENKRYPQSQFDADIQKVKDMNISHELKIEKGNALANIYFNQNRDEYIDPFAIADFREIILKEL